MTRQRCLLSSSGGCSFMKLKPNTWVSGRVTSHIMLIIPSPTPPHSICACLVLLIIVISIIILLAGLAGFHTEVGVLGNSTVTVHIGSWSIFVAISLQILILLWSFLELEWKSGWLGKTCTSGFPSCLVWSNSYSRKCAEIINHKSHWIKIEMVEMLFYF